MQQTPPLSARISAYIGLGITLVLLLIGFVVFSYVLIIGAIIGIILFVIARVIAIFKGKDKSNKIYVRSRRAEKQEHGRTFNNDDL